MKNYKKMQRRLILIYLAILFVFITIGSLIAEKNLVLSVILFLIPIVVGGPILGVLEYRFFRCPDCNSFIGNKNLGDYCQHCGKSLGGH